MTVSLKRSGWTTNAALFSEPHPGMRTQLRVAESYINEDPATSHNRTFHIVMAAFSALFFATGVLCIEFFRCKLTPGGLAALTAEVLPVVLFALYCRLRGDGKLFRASLLLCWAAIMLTLFKFPIYLAACLHMPLRDQMLARWDGHWGGLLFVHFAFRHPQAAAALNVCYNLLAPLMLLAATIPALRGEIRAAKEYIIGTSFAVLSGTAVFAVLPAAGAWTVEGFAPSARQQLCQRLLMEFRSPAIHAVTFSDSGIIGFPSFHVIFAILSAAALAPIKPLRIPAAILTTLICLSTLTTGWHYISDALAGVALAALSLTAAKAYSRYEDWLGCRRRRPEQHPKKEDPENEAQRRRPRRGAGVLPALAKRGALWSKTGGQSLIEVALFVPIFTLLISYSVDFGYCFLAAASIDAVSQNAIDYAIQGTKSPAQSAEPSGSSVAAFVIAALGLPNASSATSVQVCSNSVGTPQNNVAQCQTFGADASLSYTADTDPESPIFQLNRVDVVYTVSPPIPLPASILPSLTFHRSAEMRAIQ